MSTLKTHNLQSSDSGSVNIALAPNAGMVVTGISTFTGAVNLNGELLVGTNAPLYSGGDMRHEIKKNNSRTYTPYRMTTHSHLLINNSDTTTNAFCGLGFRAGTGDGSIGFVYTGSTNAADFVINTDGGANGVERLRIDSSGRMGLGTNNPSSFNSYARNLVIAQSSGDAGITISAQDAGSEYGSLHFSGGTTVRAYIDQQNGTTGRMFLMNKSNGYMGFGTNNTERLRISSTGNASLGLGADAVPTASSYNSGTLHLHQSSNGNYGSQIKMTTAAGGSTASDGFYIAHWGGNNSTFLYNKENTPIYFGTNSAERFVIKNDGDVEISDGNLIVASGHGIDFSATGGPTNGSDASELLDDYEEGTFTPSFDGFNSIEQQNTEWTGHYTKIGEMVFCDFYARFTSGGATTSNGSTIRLTGLPYGIENTQRVRGGGVTSYQNIASSNHTGIWSWYGSQNNTYATAYVGASNVTAANGASQAGKYIIGTFSYMAKP